METSNTGIINFFILLTFSLTVALLSIFTCVLSDQIKNIEQCPCQINYGGNNMSVEDAFERAGEGLTVDQADEVKILIEEYCSGSK